MLNKNLGMNKESSGGVNTSRSGRRERINSGSSFKEAFGSLGANFVSAVGQMTGRNTQRNTD
jgi:hypothetical protein